MTTRGHRPVPADRPRRALYALNAAALVVVIVLGTLGPTGALEGLFGLPPFADWPRWGQGVTLACAALLLGADLWEFVIRPARRSAENEQPR